MSASDNVNAIGVIIVRNEDGTFKTMHIPEAGSDRSVVMVVNSDSEHDNDPLNIELNNFPSATTVLLTRSLDGSKDSTFWMEFKTTRTNAALGDMEITNLNNFAVGDFVELQGGTIGLIVIGKQGTIRKEQLGSICVTTSAAPPTVLDQRSF